LRCKGKTLARKWNAQLDTFYVDAYSKHMKLRCASESASAARKRRNLAIDFETLFKVISKVLKETLS
jgi:hypothetical protein